MKNTKNPRNVQNELSDQKSGSFNDNYTAVTNNSDLFFNSWVI